MADASCETFGAPSSGTWITYLEYENCHDNQRRRKLRSQFAYFDLLFPDRSVTDKIKSGMWPKDFPDP